MGSSIAAGTAEGAGKESVAGFLNEMKEEAGRDSNFMQEVGQYHWGEAVGSFGAAVEDFSDAFDGE